MVLGASATECDGRLECHHIRPVEFGGTGDPEEHYVAVSLRHNNMARRAKPPRWARDLEFLGPPAFRPRAAQNDARRPQAPRSKWRAKADRPKRAHPLSSVLLLLAALDRHADAGVSRIVLVG